MSSVNSPLCGGCQCGAIRYELSHGPLQLYVCHCTECRKQSASAFGISFIVPQTALRLTQGEPRFGPALQTREILSTVPSVVIAARGFGISVEALLTR